MATARLKDRWVLGNEEDAASPWTLGLWMPAFGVDIKKRIGRAFPHFFVFEGWHMRWFVPERFATSFSRALLRRALRHPGWLSECYRQVVASSDRLSRFSRSLAVTRWRALTNRELASIFTRHEHLVREVLGWGLPPAFLDVPTPYLTNHAMGLAAAAVRRRGLARSASEYFADLTAVAEQSIQIEEAAAWEGFTSPLPAHWGFRPGRLLGAEYVDGSCNLFAVKDEYDRANQGYFQKLFTEPASWDALHRFTERSAAAMFRFARTLKGVVAERLTNQQLASLIGRFQKAQAAVHVPRGPMWLLETPNNIVSNYLHGYLAEKAGRHHRLPARPFEAFRILTTPTRKSIWAREREDLVKIALVVDRSERERRLAAHARRYEWLEYGLQGKILGLDHFRTELTKVRHGGARRTLERLRREPRIVARQQRAALRAYDVHPSHRRIFRIVQDSFYTRLYSKDSQFFGYYCLEPFLREVGRRGGLSLEQVRFLAPEDFAAVLLRGRDFSRLTTERRRYSIHLADRGKTAFFVGSAARQLRRRLRITAASPAAAPGDTVKGQPAYGGRASGRVKIINTMQEMVKMHPGNILVSHMTNPSIVPAMKQAAAIVTDLGGITCHAAIVARELKKPCVIGTKVATKVFKDGDRVEVDATKGIVRKCDSGD